MTRPARRLPIVLAAVACGCGGGSESEPLATSSKGPIVFTRGNALVAVDPDGKNERVLTRTEKVPSGSLSPDGKRIAYTVEVRPENGFNYLNVYVADADGTGRRKLRRAEINTSNLEWSPDSDELIVDDNDDGVHELWVVKADGSGARKLPTGRYAGNPAWSPDGRKIAFDEGGWIHVMNPDGTDQRRVMPGDRPHWTPTGQVTFNSEQEGIWVANADGTGRRRIARLGGDPWSVTFSPDGRHVAYAAWIERDTELYVADVATGTVTRLTSDDMHEDEPAWAPDSKSLAFTRFRPGKAYAYDWGPGDIWVINADGTGERNLTNSKADEGGPDWTGGATP